MNEPTIGKRVIVLGALSAIGEATARLFAAEGGRLVLAGRNAERLRQGANDLAARGAADARVWPIDLVACAAAAGGVAPPAGALGWAGRARLGFFRGRRGHARGRRPPPPGVRGHRD